MSFNQVNSSGELERVAGLVNSEKINEMYDAFPSDASASNQLVATSAIYKTLIRDWNQAGTCFIKLSNAYPTLGLRTNNYVVSCRNGETYLLVCGSTDGGYAVAPEVYVLYDGTGKLSTNGFYYDSATKEIAFMTQQYNHISVTQISGQVADIVLSETSETNPLSNPVAITPQQLVTESYLAGSPLIGQVTTTLGRLGFGASADNFLEIKVCPSAEITNNPFGDSGNCLYIKMGIVEFVVGALSADASQWTPNTGVAYRVRHGSVWQSWHTLTQN